MFPKQGSKAENTQLNADITLFVNKTKLYAVSIELVDAAHSLFTLWLNIKSLSKNESDAKKKQNPKTHFFSNFEQLLLSFFVVALCPKLLQKKYDSSPRVYIFVIAPNAKRKKNPLGDFNI